MDRNGFGDRIKAGCQNVIRKICRFLYRDVYVKLSRGRGCQACGRAGQCAGRNAGTEKCRTMHEGMAESYGFDGAIHQIGEACGDQDAAGDTPSGENCACKHTGFKRFRNQREGMAESYGFDGAIHQIDEACGSQVAACDTPSSENRASKHAGKTNRLAKIYITIRRDLQSIHITKRTWNTVAFGALCLVILCGGLGVYKSAAHAAPDGSETAKSTEAEQQPQNAIEILRESLPDRYIDPNKPMVALTYDDGPGGDSEKRILDCLEKNDAVATFFYTGNRVEKNADKVKRAVSLGCEIGNHTWSHSQLTKKSHEDMAKDINKTSEAIKKVTGSYPTVFRPSYGATNSDINKTSGMPVILWSIDTLDWKTRDAQKTFEAVSKNKHLDGKIVLMHSIHDSTADATEKIVPWLKKNGYQLVTVSELIVYKKGDAPTAGKVYR
jgi:peptidoglycan/xylan/chitin deacetylase (PgdA/CDA1 family)